MRICLHMTRLQAALVRNLGEKAGLVPGAWNPGGAADEVLEPGTYEKMFQGLPEKRRRRTCARGRASRPGPVALLFEKSRELAKQSKELGSITAHLTVRSCAERVLLALMSEALNEAQWGPQE